MSIKKLSFMLLSAISLTALLNGCGSSSKEGSPGGVARVADEGVCIVCHSTTTDHVSNTNIVNDFATSSHNAADPLGCEGCHGGGSQHNGVGPFPYPNPLTANRCIVCHSATSTNAAKTDQDLTALFALAQASFTTNNCAHCHTASGNGGVHAAQVPTIDSCIHCHDVAAPQHGAGLVGDNSGVRAIVPEFSRNSHHVVGKALTDADCAVCHMEGSANGFVNPAYHMKDTKIHLRNGNKTVFPATNSTDSNEFLWDPANPDHSAMDGFCMSCHNANGSTSAVGIVVGNSAKNPFNDAVTTAANGYDQQGRTGGVVAVYEQFDPANASHHGVRAPRYSTRNSATALANGVTNGVLAAGTSAANKKGFFNAAQKTLYDGGLMGKGGAIYTPLDTAKSGTTVADDSQIHCGDCHTNGQWSPLSTGFGGQFNKVVIGAHGSTNEYLLRNNVGTDQIHGLTSLVCFNCHNDKGGASAVTAKRGGYYSSVFWNNSGSYRSSEVINGVTSSILPHITGLHVSPVTSTTTFRFPTTLGPDGKTNMFVEAGRPYASTGDIGITAGIVFTNTTSAFQYNNSNVTGAATKVGRLAVNNGNITGIGCINCHNTGRQGFGGIHGGSATYTTGWSAAKFPPTANAMYATPATLNPVASTQTTYRFMPGQANYGYVPPNTGFVAGSGTVLGNAGLAGKAAWEWNGGTTVSGGCYTNNAPNQPFLQPGQAVGAINGGDNPSWSSCNHHSADRADMGGASRNTANGNVGRTLFY